MASAPVLFSWKRYWVPLHGTIHLEHQGGFLSDPEGDFGKYSNPSARTTTQIIPSGPGLAVLCGEPAMGKTTELDSYLADVGTSGGPLIKLEFRDIPNDRVFERYTIDSTEWLNWRTGSGEMTLVVDGVDEGLQKITGFVNYLARLLSSQPVARLRLILACRSAEWPAAEGDKLAALWPTTQTEEQRSLAWELCPLRRSDVELAARASGLDAENLLGAIYRQQVSGLANRPMTLCMLIREFKGGGHFSGTHRDLYLAHCRHLCSEVDESRAERLRKDDLAAQLYEVAQRIAALTLLCNRSAVFTGSAKDAEASDLTIDEIVAAPGKNKLPRPIVLEVLRTPLFWPKSPKRVHFFHQTFAECLACTYLERLPFAQLRSLLCSRDPYGAYVEPQLTELAAWIAAENRELFTYLIKHDPETLLRSDIARLPDGLKDSLATAVLERAKDEQLFDGYEDRRFYTSLNHPGLTRTLRHYIEDRNLNIVVRRMAIQIGTNCHRQDMLPILIARLGDKRDQVIHRYAAAGLYDVTTSVSAGKLIQYATGKRRLYGEANTRFWLVRTLLKHGVWSLTDALPYIDACLADKRETSGFVLASYATATDAEALLEKATTWRDCFDTLGRHHAFVVQAQKHGIARLHEPPVRALFVRMWLRARRTYEDLPQERGEPTLQSVLSQNPELRHSFIVDALRAPGRTKHDIYRLQEIADSSLDFQWLLETIPTISERSIRREMARLAATLYDFERHAKDFDLLLRRKNEVPELKAVFEWLRDWQLDEEGAVRSKAQHLEELAWRKRMQERRAPQREATKVWQEAYAGLSKLTTDSWAVAAHNFFYGRDQACAPSDKVELHDLATSPGWKYFSAVEHDEIRKAARHFLLHQSGDPYLRKGQLTDFAVYAFRALFLLRDEIEHQAELRAYVRRHWLPVLLTKCGVTDGGLVTTIPLAYRLAPNRACAKFDEILKSRLKGKSYVFELRDFTSCWNSTLTKRLLNFCNGRRLPGDFAESVFRSLNDVDRTAALTFGLQQFREPRLPRKEMVQIGALVFGHGLFEVWAEMWPILKSRPALTRSIVLTVAHNRSDHRWPISANDAPKITQLYHFVRKLFPPSKDEPTPTGAYTPTPRMLAAQFRGELPRWLAAMGTEDACGQLEAIADRLPAGERIWIRWLLREGIVGMRRKAWTAPTTGEITAMIANADSRLLRSEDDLLDLIVESLARLESHLQRRSNSPIDEYWSSRRVEKRRVFSPIAEVPAAKKIAAWLEQDLDKRKGITVQREVSVQWNQRTDLEVRTVAINDDEATPLEITIEVKGCWHPDVMTGLKSQLGEGYLKKAGRTHGVYLVLWTKCPAWNDPDDSRRNRLSAQTLEQAQEAFGQLPELNGDGYRIAPVVLDLTLSLQGSAGIDGRRCPGIRTRA